MQVQQVAQVFLDVPRGQDRLADLLGQLLQIGDHRVQVVAVHAGGGSGQPVPQLPLAIALAAASAPVLQRDAATDLGDGGVGQLHDVEQVDDQDRVRQAGRD